MKRTKIIRGSYLGLVYLFFYLPIAIVILYSFNNSKVSLLWHGFTLKWYKILFHDQSIFVVALHSLTIAILASTIATIIGTITAVSLFRYRFFGRQLLHGLLFILIVLPDIVMGISLLILYNSFKIPLGFWSLLLAHITFCIPFVAVTVYSRIITLNRDILEAAKDLGASDLTIFSKILAPLLLSSIIAGWLLSFTLSIDDVIISYFVSGPSYEILPLKIYSMVKLGVKPEINALCTILLFTTLMIVIVSQLLLKRKNREQGEAIHG